MFNAAMLAGINGTFTAANDAAVQQLQLLNTIYLQEGGVGRVQFGVALDLEEKKQHSVGINKRKLLS